MMFLMRFVMMLQGNNILKFLFKQCSTLQRTITNYVPEKKCNDVQTNVVVTVPRHSCTKVYPATLNQPENTNSLSCIIPLRS